MYAAFIRAKDGVVCCFPARMLLSLSGVNSWCLCCNNKLIPWINWTLCLTHKLYFNLL